MNTGLWVRVNQSWVKKQNDYCGYCMDTPVLPEVFKKYRCIETVPMVKEDSGEVVGTMFPVCCMYKYGFNSFKGKTRDQELYENWIKIKAIKANLFQLENTDYLLAATMIAHMKVIHPDMLVYLPVPDRVAGKKYMKYHLGTLTGVLDSMNVPYTDDLSKVELKGKDSCVVVFEVFASRIRIGKLILDVAQSLKQFEPQILYISLMNEMSKKGKMMFVSDEKPIRW